MSAPATSGTSTTAPAAAELPARRDEESDTDYFRRIQSDRRARRAARRASAAAASAAPTRGVPRSAVRAPSRPAAVTVDTSALSVPAGWAKLRSASDMLWPQPLFESNNDDVDHMYGLLGVMPFATDANGDVKALLPDGEAMAVTATDPTGWSEADWNAYGVRWLDTNAEGLVSFNVALDLDNYHAAVDDTAGGLVAHDGEYVSAVSASNALSTVTDRAEALSVVVFARYTAPPPGPIPQTTAARDAAGITRSTMYWAIAAHPDHDEILTADTYADNTLDPEPHENLKDMHLYSEQFYLPSMGGDGDMVWIPAPQSNDAAWFLRAEPINPFGALDAWRDPKAWALDKAPAGHADWNIITTTLLVLAVALIAFALVPSLALHPYKTHMLMLTVGIALGVCILAFTVLRTRRA